MKKDESNLVMGKDSYNFLIKNKIKTHISFSLILAGILCAGKKSFLGNLAIMSVCRMPSIFYCHKSSLSACAQRINLSFRGKTLAAQPRQVLYQVSIFYAKQMDRVLNFARGQTSADDTCVYWKRQIPYLAKN